MFLITKYFPLIPLCRWLGSSKVFDETRFSNSLVGFEALRVQFLNPASPPLP